MYASLSFQKESWLRWVQEKFDEGYLKSKVLKFGEKGQEEVDLSELIEHLSIDRIWVGNLLFHKNRNVMEEIMKESKKVETFDASKTISSRILVAEDDKNTQHLISDFLKFMGLEVSLADNGIEALDIFIKNCFDMVLTDLEMPFMDGFTLATKIKKRSPRTPVILLTGADREEVLVNVNEGPFYSVIFKPFKIADLQSNIKGALAFI